VRTATLQDFKQQEFYFSDKRYNSLLFNYKARYFPQALTADEQSNWLHSCRERLTNPEAGYLTLNNLQSEIEQLLTESELPVKSREILAELEAWRQHAVKKFAIDAHKNSPLD
jgi:exodeoxyribonuclease-1